MYLSRGIIYILFFLIKYFYSKPIYVYIYVFNDNICFQYFLLTAHIGNSVTRAIGV